MLTTILHGGPMDESQKVLQLRQNYPEVDLVNIEEALDGCDGDIVMATSVLRDILADEAADAAEADAASAAAAASAGLSVLHALFDTVTSLCELPIESQPVDSRSRLMAVCGSLEQSGVHLSQPVAMLLDGKRDELSLTAGLDAADAAVVRIMLGLIAAGAAVPDGGALTEAEKRTLRVEFSAEVRASGERRELEERVAAAAAELVKKGEGLELLKQAVVQQRRQVAAASAK